MASRCGSGGSHKITAPGTTAGPATARDVEIEIHPTDTTLTIDSDDGFTDAG